MKRYLNWIESIFDWNTTEPQYDYVWNDVVERVKKCLTWDEADYYWNTNNFDWNNFCIWVDADYPEPAPSAVAVAVAVAGASVTLYQGSYLQYAIIQ